MNKKKHRPTENSKSPKVADENKRQMMKICIYIQTNWLEWQRALDQSGARKYTKTFNNSLKILCSNNSDSGGGSNNN